MTSVSNAIDVPLQVSYKPIHNESPSYRIRKVPLANLQLQSVPLNQNAVTPIQWKLPSGCVFNLARSKIVLQLNIATAPAINTNAYWVYEDCVNFIDSIQMGDAANSTFMCDLSNAGRYTKIARRLGTKLKDYMTNNGSDGGNFSSLLYPSNRPNASGAATSSGAAAAPFIAQSNINPAIPVLGANAGGMTNPLEPAYTFRGAVNSTLSRTYSVELDAFKNTIFSYDKDIYMGNSDTYINVNLSPFSRIGYVANADGSVATSVIIPSNTTVNVSNVWLYLAVEQNESICAEIKNKYNRDGLTLYIPFTRTFVFPTQGSTTGNFQVTLSPQMGQFLKQVLYVPFNGSTAAATIYYDSGNVNNSKVIWHRTYLGANPLQDDLINNTVIPESYLVYNQQYCEDTPFINLTSYLMNWFHLDRFYTSNEIVTDDNNSALGVPMKIPIDYRVESNITSTNIDHTIFATFVRVIKLTPLGNTYSQ
jgi:hypothetical protein